MSSTIETTSPGERASRGRKSLHTEWIASPEYQEVRRQFLIANPWCEEYLAVGRKVEARQVHHVNKWSYRSKALFCDLFNNGAIAVSVKGHWCNHNNSKICPDCKDNVCNIKAQRCTKCETKINPVVKAGIEQGIQEQKERNNRKARSRRALKHPCSRRGKEQKCRRKSGLTCQYSPNKAENCDYFVARSVSV